MIDIKQARIRSGNDLAKDALPLGKRPWAQIPAGKRQNIESIKVRILSAIEQAVELGTAIAIQADDFAVKDNFVRKQRQRRAQDREGFVNVCFSGDQTSSARLW